MKSAREYKLKNYISNNLYVHDIDKNQRRSNSKNEKAMILSNSISTNLKKNFRQTNQQVINHRLAKITKILIYNVLKKNLAKHSTNLRKYYIKMTNDIIYDERKHLVCMFKDYLLWDESSDFLKRFYYTHESVNRIPKISAYYEKYSLMNPVYFKLSCNRIMARVVRKKKKILEILEENDDKYEEDLISSNMVSKNEKEIKDDYTKILKTSLIEDEKQNTQNHEYQFKNTNAAGTIELNNDLSMNNTCLSFFSLANDNLLLHDYRALTNNVNQIKENSIMLNSFTRIRGEFINTSSNFSIYSQLNGNLKSNTNTLTNEDKIEIKKMKTISPGEKLLNNKQKIGKNINDLNKNNPINQNNFNKNTIKVSSVTPPHFSSLQTNLNEKGKVTLIMLSNNLDQINKKIEFNKLDLKNINNPVTTSNNVQTSTNCNLNSLNVNNNNYLSSFNSVNSINNIAAKFLPHTTRSNKLIIDGIATVNHSKIKSLEKVDKKTIDVPETFASKCSLDMKNKIGVKNMVNKLKNPLPNEEKSKTSKISISRKNSKINMAHGINIINPNKSPSINTIINSAVHSPANRIKNLNHNVSINNLKNSKEKNNVLKVKISEEFKKTNTSTAKNIQNDYPNKYSTNANKNINNYLDTKKSLSDQLKSNSVGKSKNALNRSSIYNINLNLNLNLNLNMMNKNYTNTLINGNSKAVDILEKNIPLTERPSIIQLNNSKSDKIEKINKTLDKNDRSLFNNINNLKSNEKFKKLSRNMNVKNFILNHGTSGASTPYINSNEGSYLNTLKGKKYKNIVLANNNLQKNIFNKEKEIKINSSLNKNVTSSNNKIEENSNKNNLLSYYNKNNVNNYQSNFNSVENSNCNSFSNNTQKKFKVQNKNPIDNLKFNLFTNNLINTNVNSNYNSNSNTNANNTICLKNQNSNSQANFNQIFKKDEITLKKPLAINIKKNRMESSKDILNKYPLTARNERDYIKIFGKI